MADDSLLVRFPCPLLLFYHRFTDFGTLREDLRAGTAMVVVVLSTLLGTLPTDCRAESGHRFSVCRPAREKLAVEGCDVRHVTAAANTLAHTVEFRTLVGTPLAHFDCLPTQFQALAFALAQMRCVSQGL